jgi:hypothetical protein
MPSSSGVHLVLAAEPSNKKVWFNALNNGCLNASARLTDGQGFRSLLMRTGNSRKERKPMSERSDSRLSIVRLIAIPAVITLGITVLRLIGEMQGWPSTLVNPQAGGGGAVIGIVWLVPIFGIYFALKLTNDGQGPASPGRAALFGLLGLLILVAGFALAFAVSQPGLLGAQLTVGVAAVVATLLQRRSWPALFKTLLAYGYAARIPVTVIMFFAIRGNWGTHYDGPPPGFPADISWFPKFILIGVFPQLFFWVAFTVIVGTLFGAATAAIVHRGKRGAVAEA